MAIDPVLQELLDSMPTTAPDTVPLEDMRRSSIAGAAAQPRAAQLPRVEDRTADGVGVRLYWPRAGATGMPVVVYFHGGGFFMGNLDTHDNVARTIAARADAVVVAVDYRLAPEHPYPAAVEDASTVVRWVGEHAAELGGDPSRLAVAGDSSGGNLAALMALHARDAGGPDLCFQLMWYPVTHFDPTLPSAVENAGAPLLSRRSYERLIAWYLGDRDPRTSGAAPAYAAGHAGLPPAYIATVQTDVLRDEGVRYARILRDAGVAVEHRNHTDLVHAFCTLASRVPAAAAALGDSLTALGNALAPVPDARGRRPH
ncbi:alpha/beta hydrolase [Streptomyces sp. LARHCF249]